MVTNEAFARRVGCDYTTASRYRNGQRLPSYAMMQRIAHAFELPLEALATAAARGAPAFGKYLRRHVFNNRQVA